MRVAAARAGFGAAVALPQPADRGADQAVWAAGQIVERVAAQAVDQPLADRVARARLPQRVRHAVGLPQQRARLEQHALVV